MRSRDEAAAGNQPPRREWSGEDEELVFLLRADCPPFAAVPPDGGEPVGLDADTARALAALLGVECRLLGVRQEEIMARFLGGEADALITATPPGAEHEPTLEFSLPIYRSRGVLVVAAHSRQRLAEKLPPPDRLRLLAGTAHNPAFLHSLPTHGANPPATDTWENLVNCLAAGRCDAVLADALAVHYRLRNQSNRELVLLPMPTPNRHPSTVRLGVRKGKGALRHSLDCALRDLRMNGSLRRIQFRYFPFDIE